MNLPGLVRIRQCSGCTRDILGVRRRLGGRAVNRSAQCYLRR